MSDAVVIAITASVCTALPLVLAQIVTAIRDSRKDALEREQTRLSREALMRKVVNVGDQVNDVAAVALRSKEEMETHAIGAGRRAVEEYQRKTLPGGLHEYDPRTDVGKL